MGQKGQSRTKLIYGTKGTKYDKIEKLDKVEKLDKIEKWDKVVLDSLESLEIFSKHFLTLASLVHYTYILLPLKKIVPDTIARVDRRVIPSRLSM